MGKYCKGIVILLCLLFASSAYAVSPAILHGMSGGASASTCDTTNIVFWWRAYAADFTATNNTLDYSANDTTGIVQGPSSIHADASYFVTGNGVYSSGGYGRVDFDEPSETIDDEFRVGFWVKINTWVDGNSFWRITQDGDNTADLRMSGSDELYFYWEDNNNVATALVTTDANISTGTWYFIQIAGKTSTNYREIFVDGSAPGTWVSSASISSFAGAPYIMYIGDVWGGASDFYLDNIIISTDSTVDLFTNCKDEEEWPE